jgi:hypothetical protein
MMTMDQKSVWWNEFAVNFCVMNKENKTINEWMRLVDRKTYVHGYIDMLNLDLRKESS